MRSKYPQIDLSNLRTIAIKDRKSKVSAGDFARVHKPGDSVGQFIDKLPDILAGRWLRRVIDCIVDARKRDKACAVAMGAHVIKCGLSPMLIDLMRRGIITSLSMNGAGAIHDSEIAFFGETSEDVVEGMQSGLFGMARETADFVNDCAAKASADESGFGETLGRAVIEAGAPNCELSLLAAAYQCNVPLTVHACIGCDIVHMHPNANGAAIGDASMRDCRILTEALRGLDGGGVLMNIGSAVVLPEVLLKAITTLLNLGCSLNDMVGVNLDFVQHYRSNQQIVARVREIGGEGISLTGHHELMIPLIAAGIIERMDVD